MGIGCFLLTPPLITTRDSFSAAAEAECSHPTSPRIDTIKKVLNVAKAGTSICPCVALPKS